MVNTAKRKRATSRRSIDLTMRQTKQAKISPFADLPAELIKHIFNFCDTSTLRIARLGCSIWAYEMIGPFLFHTITLIPHLYFMDRFLFTFQKSRLKSVRKMVIDMRWVEQMVGIHDLHLDGEINYNAKHRAHDLSHHNLEQLYEIYRLDRTQNLRALDSAVLTAIFTCVPSLTVLEVNCWGDPSSPECWSDEGPTYCSPYPPCFEALLNTLGVERRDGFRSSDHLVVQPPAFHLSLVSALSTSLPHLKQLSLHRVDPWSFIEDIAWSANGDGTSNENLLSCVRPLNLLTQVINRLDHLDLRLVHVQSLDERDQLATDTVRMLQQLKYLPSLRLHVHDPLPCRLNERTNWEDDRRYNLQDDCISFFEFVLSHPDNGPRLDMLPRLKTLWLQDVVGTASELLAFLCVQTGLRSLTLKNFFLLPSRTEPDKMACWVDTLTHVKSMTLPQLTSIDFGGFLSNLGRQHWHITEDDLSRSEPESLKARMIEWCLDKTAPIRACPLIAFVLPDGQLDATQEEDVLLAATDESWSTTCPHGPKS